MYQPSKLTPICCDIVRQQASLTHRILENTWRNKIFNEAMETTPHESLDTPFSSLVKEIKILYGMTDHIEELYNFLNNPKSKAFQSVLGSQLEWRNVDELTLISTGGLENGLIRNTERDIEDILSGRKEYSKVIAKYTDSSSIDNICSRFFSSTIPNYIQVKRLSGMNSIKIVTFDTDLVRQKLLPWIMRVLDCNLKSGGDFNGVTESSYVSTVNYMKDRFSNIYKELSYQSDAACVSIRDGNNFVTTDQIHSLYSNINRCVFAAECRLLVLLYRTVTATIANIRNLYALYIKASKWNAGIVSENFSEEFEDDGDYGNIPNLSVTNNFLMMEAADKLRSSVMNTYSISDERYENIVKRTVGFFPNSDFSQGNAMVDLSFYNMALKALNDLSARVANVIEDIRDSSDPIVLSKMLDKHNLYHNPDNYLNGFIRNGNPDPNYTGNEVTDIYLGDIRVWVTALKITANLIQEISKQCEDMRADIRNNVNGKYDLSLDGDRDTTVEWFSRMYDAIGKINVELGFMFRRRLSVLATMFKSIAPFSDVSPAYDLGDTPIHVKDGVDMIVAQEEAIAEDSISKMNRYYMNLYKRKLQGLPYMEADDAGNEQKDTQGSTDNNTSGGNKKPVVHDNAEQNDSSDNKSNDGDRNKYDANKSSSGKIIDRVKNAVARVKEILKKFVDDKLKEKNVKFIEKHKTFLMTRNYTNTHLEIYPYTDKWNHLEIVKNAITQASTINDGVLKSSDEKGIRNALFSGVNFTDDGTIKDQLVHAFKVGNAKMEYTTIKDNEVKNFVVKGLDFIEYYHNKFESDLDAMSSEIDNLSILDGKSGSGDDDKTSENVKRIGEYIIAAIDAAKTASKDRYNDTLDVFSQLVPKTTKKDTNNEQQQNESK